MSARLATNLKPTAFPANSSEGVMAESASGWSRRRMAGWLWQTDSDGPLSDEVCAAFSRYLQSASTTGSSDSASIRGLTLVKRGSQRTVWRWDYETESVYIKCYARAGWSVALRSLLRGGMARYEAQQLAAVRQSGLTVPTVWGWATCRGGAFSSLLVTAGISGARPVSQWLADPRTTPQQRHSLLTSLGEFIVQCASAGWTHHDFHGENLLARLEGSAWKLTLVDTAAMRRVWGTVSRTHLFVQLRHSLHLSLSRGETLRLAQRAGLLSVRSSRTTTQPANRQRTASRLIRPLQQAASRFSLAQWVQQDRKWARGNSKQQVWYTAQQSGRALANIDPQSVVDWISCRDVPAGLISLSFTTPQLAYISRRCVVRAVPQADPASALSAWLGGLALWRRGLPVLQPKLVCWTHPQAAWIGLEHLSTAVPLCDWLEHHSNDQAARQQILNTLTRWYQQAGETGCQIAEDRSTVADPASWFVSETAHGWQILAGARLFNRVTFHRQRVQQHVPSSLVKLVQGPLGERSPRDREEAA